MKVLLLITMLAAHGGNATPETVVLDSMQDCMTLMSAVQQRAHEYGHMVITQCTYQRDLEEASK